MNSKPAISSEKSSIAIQSHHASERVLRYEEVDTGRSVSFVGAEFRGLQYADLLNHKLNTKIKIPLSFANARVVESNIDDIPLEVIASMSTTLESIYSSKTIGLVRDGWLPSGLALQDNMVVMPDRCTISELAGRFRNGAKVNQADNDFLDFFADQHVRINPLLYALEGNVKRNPSPDVIEQQYEHASTLIRAALPMAEVVPAGKGGIQGIIGIVSDTQASMAQQQEFLIKLAKKLSAPISARLVDKYWDEVLTLADACGVPRRSLVVLAALSVVCVPNNKSPAKKLLKLRANNYSEEHAYNALADLRSLELLMRLFALFPNEKLLLCTGDKDLALFWTGIRAHSFVWSKNEFECRFSPIEALFPNVMHQQNASYFSTDEIINNQNERK